jgi:hypothetical protein
MPIKLLLFCPLSTKRIKCNILAISVHHDFQSRSWKACRLGYDYVFSIGQGID